MVIKRPRGWSEQSFCFSFITRIARASAPCKGRSISLQKLTVLSEVSVLFLIDCLISIHGGKFD